MSIKHVAHLAGVSTATVSHVINNTRFVRAETRLKVLAAIDAANYTPNAHARSLAAGYSRTLGLIVSDVANPFFPELVKSIQDNAADLDYDVILANTNYERRLTVSCVERMLQQKVRGVAIMTSEMDPSLIERLAERKVAVVFLDLGPVGPHTSNINVDYERGVRAGVEHLLDLGHRRIAFVGGPRSMLSADRCWTAFVETMQESRGAERTKPVMLDGDFTAPSGQRAAREILKMAERPTAVVFANDLMAIGALGELRRGGARVPDDISVVGFDDISFAALTDPPLTTIAFPRAEVGRAAVEALMQTIAADDALGREVKVATRLVVRESTGEALR
jgi:LacI family transcriptional regulator